jgi:hypothetical protein
MAKMTDEQLVAVLCESDWYIRLCNEWLNFDVPFPEESLLSWVHARHCATAFARWTEPYITEMLALVQEIESDEPLGSATCCTICASGPAVNVSVTTGDARVMYVCTRCSNADPNSIHLQALRATGLRNLEPWSCAQFGLFVMAARRIYLGKGGTPIPRSDLPVDPVPGIAPAPRPVWDVYLARERDVAACQKAIDRDAYLRTELDRPMVKPKYPRPLVAGDLLGNPWNRRK